jgi:sugar lactone lactonase YvrE
VLAQLPFAPIPDNAPGTAPAQFNDPVAVAAAPDGSLVVGTRYNVRRIASDGAVSPVIGLLGSGSFNGTGSAADVVDASAAVVVDPAGVIYFADVSSIRAIDLSRTARTIAGAASVPNDNSGQGQGAVDGPAATARFSRVTGLARAPNGDLFAADSLNFAIRRIDTAGNVSTYAGAMGQQGTTDGARTSARFMQPSDLSYAPDGSLWLLDRVPAAGTYVVRHIAPDGSVTTLPARARRLTVDPAGTVYVLTEGLDLARMDAVTGAMTVLVRNGAQLSFGSDPRIAGDVSWTFTAVGVKQLVLMSDRQLIKATLP